MESDDCSPFSLKWITEFNSLFQLCLVSVESFWLANFILGCEVFPLTAVMFCNDEVSYE